MQIQRGRGRFPSAPPSLLSPEHFRPSGKLSHGEENAVSASTPLAGEQVSAGRGRSPFRLSPLPPGAEASENVAEIARKHLGNSGYHMR